MALSLHLLSDFSIVASEESYSPVAILFWRTLFC